jgi:class 3 adenylate cyclase
MGGDDVLKSSSTRLWKLVEERTRSGADTAAIDQRIWDLFGDDRAIMFTDLVGFSRQVSQFGIIHFLQIIFEQKRLLLPIVERFDGVLVKVEADSFLILFKNATRAIACAVEMQKTCQRQNARTPPEDHVILCVGIGQGPILKIGDEDVFGNEVNLASKLGEDLAKGNEILVTRTARAAAGDHPGVTWEEVAAEFANETMCWRARY